MSTATFQVGQLFAPSTTLRASTSAPTATGKKVRALCAYEGTFTSMTGAKRKFTPALLQKLADDSNAHLSSGVQAPVFYTNHDYNPKDKAGLIVGPYEAKTITETDLPDPNLTDLVGKFGVFTMIELIREEAIADYDNKLIKPISMSVDWEGEHFTKGAIYEISLVGFAAIPGAQLFSGQPRHAAGSPNGGQFAPKEGSGSDYKSAKGFDEVEIESVGKFQPTDPDTLAEGGAIAAGSIEVNAYTAHSDKDDRAEGISDQYFLGMGEETYKEIAENPDLLKAVIATHAEHIAKGSKDDFTDIPGTNYKLYSDPSAPEIPSLFTKDEYDNFSFFAKRKNMDVDFKELAQQALDLSAVHEKFGLTLSDQVAKEELMPKLYRLFDAFTTLIREIYEEDNPETAPESKDALIQRAIADLSVGIASRLRVGNGGSSFSLDPDDGNPPPEDETPPDDEEDMSKIEDLQAQIAELKQTTELQEAYSALHAKAGVLVDGGYLTPALYKSDFEAESFGAKDIQAKFGGQGLGETLATIREKSIELHAIEKFSTPVRMGTRVHEPLEEVNQAEEEAESFMSSYSIKTPLGQY